MLQSSGALMKKLYQCFKPQRHFDKFRNNNFKFYTMDPHDEALFAMMLEQDIDDEETEEVDRYQTLTALAHIVVGMELGQLSQIERHKIGRLYLCRPQLLPNPHDSTPWQTLLRSQSDHAYITTMGIDVATFEYIITSGFGQRWYLEPIPHPDANSSGYSHPGA